MLLIGSAALQYHDLLSEGRVPKDVDYICTFEEFQAYSRKNKDKICRSVPLASDKFHVILDDGVNREFEIAWPGTTGYELLRMETTGRGKMGDMQVASVAELLMLKESHKYLKNSPHFWKTMADIHYLRKLVPEGLSEPLQALLKRREEETYTYAHPNLNQSKEGFFREDGIRYVYDHDSLHEAVAVGKLPAYVQYLRDGSEVMTDSGKFYSVPEYVRLLGVYEESCVLALERSQIPYDFKPAARWSFEMALMKVCTSITSGYFRAWAWEHAYQVLALYEAQGEADYVDKFYTHQDKLLPFRS